MTSLLVGAEHDGWRLDAILQGVECAEFGPLSQKKARQVCAIGAVAVDDVQADGTQRLRAGSAVTFAAEHAALALDLGIPVAYADDRALVLWKPAGLAVHKGPLVEASVADALARELPGSGLAHRLDREASGLLLCGRDSRALATLGAAMETGGIARDYLAIVGGEFAGEQRTIDLALRVTDEPDGSKPKTVVDPQGQRAVSHVTVVDRRVGATLVRVRLDRPHPPDPRPPRRRRPPAARRPALRRPQRQRRRQGDLRRAPHDVARRAAVVPRARRRAGDRAGDARDGLPADVPEAARAARGLSAREGIALRALGMPFAAAFAATPSSSNRLVLRR
ncbi:MAG: hypothetical protein FJ306_04770 [Planctomycetes bacterium]|nr:hypothetical protein [Planctomycetota bacterium]